MKLTNIKNLNDMNIFMNVDMNQDVLSEEDKAMTQEVIANCDAIEEAMEVRNEINEAVEDIIADIETFVAEGEKLHTAELLKHQFECDRNAAILESILEDKEMIIKYGNKTISRHREVVPALNKVPTGCDKSLIQITMDTYRCTYSQAVSKLAQKFNINYDHSTWFKTQLEIIEHNRKLLNNPTEIVMKYPQLWNKMKHNAHMRKYFEFLLDLFQTQLEHKGVSCKGGKKPLIASASCGFTAKSLRVGHQTAKTNMDNLALFGATKKLTDKEVKKVDESRYESIQELANGWKQTITTYELILWDDEVLSIINDRIVIKKEQRLTREGHCYQAFNAIGFGDVLNKSEELISDKDKESIASLKKWARKKVYEKGGCGFITQNDWNSRFNNADNKNTIWAGEHTRDKYETKVMADLGLVYAYATNELKSIMNSKKLNQVKHQCKVWIPVEVANKLNRNK